jgi:hypothetical protein
MTRIMMNKLVIPLDRIKVAPKLNKNYDEGLDYDESHYEFR